MALIHEKLRGFLIRGKESDSGDSSDFWATGWWPEAVGGDDHCWILGSLELRRWCSSKVRERGRECFFLEREGKSLNERKKINFWGYIGRIK